MTVTELIGELSGCDPALRVFLDDEEVTGVWQTDWTADEKREGLEDRVYLVMGQ